MKYSDILKEKINDSKVFDQYKSPIPTIDDIDSVNENTTFDVTINNYDSNATYEVTGDLVVESRSKDTITFKTPSVDEDTTKYIYISCIKEGMFRSDKAVIPVTVVNVPIKDDQAIVNSDILANSVYIENLK